MPFLQLTIDVGLADPALAEDLLFGMGAVSVTLEDAADNPVLEPAPGETPLWPRVRLRALFAADADRDGLAEALRRGLSRPIECRFDEIADQAWERSWLEDFRPMRFGRRLWVCPAGMPAGDPDAIVIDLDPGLAFGTGTHPTTALCLDWLEGRALAGRDVVDYGCGSGILAIAALKLGAAKVRAVDIDPQALLATRENALRNGVATGMEITPEPGLPERSADVVVANILAGPLVQLAPAFASALRSGGELALSGLLVQQADAVTGAYRPWFDIALTATRDGWGLVSGRRRAQ